MGHRFWVPLHQDTVLQNTPPDPGHSQLIVAGRDDHLDLRPPTMRTLGEVAQRAQTDHALTHRGHTPLGAAHATAYVHARDLTATATNRQALRARDGHTPVQRSLRIRKERLSSVAVLPQPCLLCGGPEEIPVHMHVGCAHSRLLWPHYRQAVHEAARHLPPGDKALWVASWCSAGAAWTEVFCSGLVPEDPEAQLRAIARYDPAGGTSVDNFLHHMLRLGDFAWELRNHRLEQLLREPLSAAAQAHRWLTPAEGDPPPPPPRPDKDFVASLSVANCNLECPPQEGPHPYQDLPGGFSKHLQDALFLPWIIGRGSMTAWEALIVGEEWAREWSRWCAATRAPDTPAQRYTAILLEGWGPDTRPGPTVIRGAGPDHPWDAATGEWLQAAPGPQTGWTGDVSSLVRMPVPPRIVLHAATVLRATEIRKWGHATATVRWHPPEDGAAQLAVAHFKTGGPVYDDTLSRLGDTQGPLLLMPPTDLAAALPQELDCCEGLLVGWEAVADGTLLALLHRDAANGCQWDTLAHNLTGRHVYMATPPQGPPARRGTTSSPPSTTTGFSPTTRGGRSSGRGSAGTTGAASAPACWRSGTPSDRGGTTSGSAISTLGRRPPTSHTPADSAGNVTRCPPQRRQAPESARGAPWWPRAPGLNLPQARAVARRRRTCTGASRGHTPPHTNARAPRALPFCGSTCTCGTPHPLPTCHTCWRPDPLPPPPFAEPAVPCHADGGMGRDTPGPTAKRRRRPSRARWQMRWRRRMRRTLPHDVPHGECEGFPQRDRFPGRLRPERSRGPYATPSDAPDRERHPAGAHRPGGGPLWGLDGVARVQLVGPASVHGGHPAADGSGVCHVPPQQRPSPAARPQYALPRGHGPVPEPGAGHIPGGSVRAGCGAPPSTPTGRGPGGMRNHGVRGRRGRGARPPPADQPCVRQHQADPPVRHRVRGVP